MPMTDRKVNVAFDVAIEWRNGGVRHREHFHVRRGNLWRDIWAAGLGEFLASAEPGAATVMDLAAGGPVPRHDDCKVMAVRKRDIRVDLRVGRFYPRGLLPPAAGVFAGDMRPFRVTGLDGPWVIADLNHPLSPYRLAAEVTLRRRREKVSEIGGSCIDWIEEAAGGGPGMQVPLKETETDFSSPNAFRREDEAPDGIFYQEKRMVSHIDGQAGAHLRETYGTLIPRGAAVLDLMSSWQSHFPDGMEAAVTGLGMNGEEMAANTALSESVVHDLNAEPYLPFAAGMFDAVVCSLSFEYLTRPREVIADAARVLRPGGLLLVSLSERWFPTKAVRLWQELHPFERLGFVAAEIRCAGGFFIERTETFRNWPRPVDDPHFPAERLSDPVYLIAARRLANADS
jgi:hypothetical protein